MATTIFTAFSQIPKGFRSKVKCVIIDDLTFKFHYRCTTLILFVATLLVSTQEFFGEHIHCICDNKAVPEKVMNTYCFFTSTFTLMKHYNATLVRMNGVAHPGVGPMVQGVDEEIHHAYYQWVPFVLFLQAIMFYMPHYLWKQKEDGQMKRFIIGMEFSAYSLLEKNISINDKKIIPTSKEKDVQIDTLKRIFVEKLHINSTWTMWLLVCESLNVANLILQVYLTDRFLSGKFFDLGMRVVHGEPYGTNILDVVFPKVTKCTFYKYGHSGSLQAHDAMCIMALNIINEKIFTFLWFWYVILGTATALGLLYRVLTIVLHSRSSIFNKFIFSRMSYRKLNPWHLLKVSGRFYYSDWLFLYYMSKNLDPLVFHKIFIGIAEQMDETTSLIH